MTRVFAAIFGLALATSPATNHAQIALFSPGNADESPSFLGVLLQDVTAENVGDLGLKREHGAICAEVVSNTPAEQAGLEANDVIVRWDGTRVRSARQLQRLVQDTPVGRTVKIGILRDGDAKQMPVTVGERPASTAQGTPFHDFNMGQIPLGPWHPPIDGNPDPFSQFVQPERPRLGVAMQPLTDQLASFFGLDHDVSGVLVVSVVEDSPAAAAGLRAGDVITEIEGEPVAGPAEVQAGVRRAEGHINITIVRNKKVRHLEAGLDAENAADEDDLKEEISYPRGTM